MNPYSGAALCCGEVPIFGAHKHHSYNGRNDLEGFGFYCPKCFKSSSVLDSGNKDVCLKYWNKKIQAEVKEYVLDAPIGYQSGTLDAFFFGMGHKLQIRQLPFIAFKIQKEKNKDYYLNVQLFNFITQTEIDFSLPIIKSMYFPHYNTNYGLIFYSFNSKWQDWFINKMSKEMNIEVGIY